MIIVKSKKGITTVSNFVLVLLLLFIFMIVFYIITNNMQSRIKEVTTINKVKNCAVAFRSELLLLTKNINDTENVSIKCFDSIVLRLSNSSIDYEYSNTNQFITGNLSTYGVPFCSYYIVSNKDNLFKYENGCLKKVN